ncbi:CD209 antigen-like protein E [Sphaeramia orbicularis]|uniref:CD209 antigen-like protein E n=1 Tax=Sphaeramia orbicularis TaxID=375764 RepID=UPI00117C3366|nr:CD209 antigen-like protein E [Sphaeramia orbicularis]
MKMESKPSVNQTAPQVSNRSLRGAVVFLGFFCGFLLVGLIGLGVYNIVSIHTSAAKRSSIKVHLQTRTDQISNLTADRDQLNTRIIDVMEEVERLKSETKKVCPSTWELLSGRCYFFSTQRKSWTDSRSDCRSQGGDLVIINNIEEQRIMWTPTHIEYWIGLSDSEQEGVWKWVDGSALTLRLWYPNQPNDYNGGQDCGISNYDNWNDLSCNEERHYVCEKPLILYEQF